MHCLDYEKLKSTDFFFVSSFDFEMGGFFWCVKIKKIVCTNIFNKIIDKAILPLGINVFGVNGLVTVIDVCAMVLDGNAVICVLPKASTKLTREKKQEEKKHISKLALPLFRFCFFF